MGAQSSQDLELYAVGDLSRLSSDIRERVDRGRVAPSTMLLAAGCARRLARATEFQRWLTKANVAGAKDEAIELEKQLFEVQLGSIPENPAALLAAFDEQGVLSRDAWEAVVLGLVAAGDFGQAKVLLENWRQAEPTSVQLSYAAAVYWRAVGEFSEAIATLKQAITVEPRNELAYLALSELYANQPISEPEKSRVLLEFFVEHFPENREAPIRLASLCRRLGRAHQAKELLTGTQLSGTQLSGTQLSGTQLNEGEQLEMAEIEFDLGNYETAVELLSAAGLSTSANFRAMVDQVFRLTLGGQGAAGESLMERNSLGATALALTGRRAEAEEVTNTGLNRVARIRRYIDLIAKQDIYAGDPGLAAAIESVVNLAESPAAIDPPPPAPVEGAVQALPGYPIYVEHCAVCHGGRGDGMGSAARHLFPRPRDLRHDPMRYVSSLNGLATDEDLRRVIRQGLTGVSMPGNRLLSDQDVIHLIQLIREFQRAGLDEQYAANLAKSDTTLEDSDREAWIARRWLPGEVLEIPEFTQPTDEQLLRGKLIFNRSGCNQCHPLDGTLPLRLFDTAGLPLVSRNLQTDALRGGTERSEIYKRIVVGMPGTPHPAFVSDTPEETIDLVHYVAALQNPEPAKSSNFGRLQQSFSGN